MKKYYVYLLASKRNGTLYVGVTNDIVRRMCEHKMKMNEGFTARYDVTRLVYVDTYDSIAQAIRREKQIKSWKRIKKLKLIETKNPCWNEIEYW